MKVRLQRTSTIHLLTNLRPLPPSPTRFLSPSKRHSSSSKSKPANPSHWLTTQKARIGTCISFGLDKPQLRLCSQILSILSTEWRLLTAGREGFISSRPAVERHKVVWGEMDSMGHVNNVMYVRYAETGRVEVC